MQFIYGRKAVCFLLLMNLCFNGFAQKVSFFEKKRVYTMEANPAFQVKYIHTKNDVLEKRAQETYNAAGNLISYQKENKPDWSKAKVIAPTTAGLPEWIKEEDYLLADIKPEEGRLLLYFWPWDIGEKATAEQKRKKEEANLFYKDHTFSIEVPDRINLSFKSTAFHAGPMTLPMKVFLGGPDSISKVSTAVSVGFYLGYRSGHTKYVKLPDQKEFASYETSHSWNVVFGLTKLDLDDKNTKDDGKEFKGSIAALTTGLAYGLHIKNFTLLASIGLDHPLSKKGKLWSLKGRPWIGFGAGFDIF